MPAECYACKKSLQPVFPDGNPDIDQYENALFVEFTGGYGEFVDVMDDPNPYKAVICHECAHTLCNAVPWINKLIDPANSHSHSAEYIKTNLHHFGWDYSYSAGHS